MFMSKNRIKFILFVAALLIGIPTSLIGFLMLNSFIAAFNSGADPASIFRGHRLILPTEDQAQWMSTDVEGTQPNQNTLENLISAYWFAWEALARAYQTGDSADLPTYWAGAALDQVQAADPSSSMSFVHNRHRLYLRFLSDDMTVAVVDDVGFQYHITQQGVEFVISANATLVLTLDNSFWRIREYTIDFMR